MKQTHQLLEQESKEKQELNQQLEEMKLKVTSPLSHDDMSHDTLLLSDSSNEE